MPAGEAERQIRLNEETNRRLLGSAWRPQGFYPPEMAWEHAPAALVRGGGHRWVVISGIACPVPWPTREVWSEETEHGDLAVLFRDDLLSNLIAFRQVDAPGFIQALGQVEPRYGDRYVVLAMDAETFGHHLPGWEEVFLGRFFELIGRGDTCPRILPAMLSDIAGHFEHGGHVIPIASSWSTSRDDLNHGNPYPLWRMRGNELHRLQWRHMQEMGTLMDLAQHFGHRDSADLRTARAFADMAWHSCQFWWASRRPHWSVNMVQRGLNMQRQAILNAARAINAGDTPDEVRHDAHERIALARTLAARLEDRLAWD